MKQRYSFFFYGQVIYPCIFTYNT